MEFTFETITPEMAKCYLETSPYNRVTTSSKKVATTYAKAMQRGEWKLNGESIIFDKENRLLDGHHRMIAVTIAQIPVVFSVCRGVDRNSFTTYNCGLRTNLAQILSMKEVKNANIIMGIIGININLCSTGRIRSNNGTTTDNTSRTVTGDFNIYLLDKESYDEVAQHASRLRKYGEILTASWIGGIIYYLTHRGGYEMKEVLPFFEAVCHLNTSGISSCDMLREFIIRKKMKNMKIDNGFLAALVIKSWNAYITGKQVKQLRFNQEVEDYPKFIIH